MADASAEVAEQKTPKTPVLDTPATGLGAQAANSLTSRDANAPKSGPSEVAKSKACSIYGTLDLTDLANGAANTKELTAGSTSVKSFASTFANPYGSLPKTEIFGLQADARQPHNPFASLNPDVPVGTSTAKSEGDTAAPKTDAIPGAKTDATAGAKTDATPVAKTTRPKLPLPRIH